MTRTEFLELCKTKNISANTIHFENSVFDGYYLLKNHHCWEVFFRERGKDYDCIGFPSESDALEYLFNKLIPHNNIRQDAIRTTIQKDDYVFEVDVEKTIAYYKAHSLCACDYCQNYYVQIKGKFPKLETFFSEFGIDISKPDEIKMSLEADDEIDHIGVDYTVCGKIKCMGQNKIDIADNQFISLGITDGYLSPNEQTSDYFTISICNQFSLPWASEESLSEKTKSSIRKKISGFFQKLFKA